MRTPLSALAAGFALTLLSSCSRLSPVILVNESNLPIELRYTFELRATGSSEPVECRHLAAAPRFVPAIVSSNGRTREDWRGVHAFELDESTCTMSFQLPARSSAILSLDGLCHGIERMLEVDPEALPRIKSLIISAPEIRLELTNWTVAKSFEARSSGACIYRWG